MPVKRAMDVELLLRWAYQDELPKKRTSSAAGMENILGGMILLGTKVDISRTGGGAQRYAEAGTMHPDAAAIELAVGRLTPRFVDLATDEQREWLMGDLAGLLPERTGAVNGAFAVSAWVTQHAVLGMRPAWELPAPKGFPRMASKGPHPIVVGSNISKNYYTEGSYCPLDWDPTGSDIAEACGYWVTWRDALVELAEVLKLEDHQALPPEVPADPWRTPERRRPVLPSLVIGPHALKSLPIRPQRPMPERPKRRRLGQGGEVRRPLG